MFAIWRIPAPWQPLTKKGQGQRMGGGKGAIDHYVTPIKAGRVIVELGGKCEFDEVSGEIFFFNRFSNCNNKFMCLFKVKNILEVVCHKLPFKAIVVSQEILDQRLAKEQDDIKNNINPYTMKYVIQNNLGGCHNWLSKYDHKWFGKYL